MDDLYAVAIFDNNDSVTPVIHNVCHSVAKSIARHYNRIFRNTLPVWDDTYCMVLSQTYCTNWRCFILNQ